MAAIGQTTNPREISFGIAAVCREIGENQALLPSWCEEMKDENKSLDDIGEKKIRAIVQDLGQFAVTESNFRKLQSQVTAVIGMPKETVQVWKDQLEWMQPQLNECTRQGNDLFEGILRRVGSLYHQTLMRLEEFRKSRNSNHREDLQICSSTFNRWVMKIPYQPLGFVNPRMSKKSLELLDQSKFFSLLLIIPTFLRALDETLSNLPTTISHQQAWKSLSPELKDAVDQEYSKLSKEASENGKAWLESNRFWPPAPLRLAYIEAAKALLLKKHPNLSKEDYCTLLHKCAFGNEFSDPVEWVRQELPYLESLLPEVDRLFERQASS